MRTFQLILIFILLTLLSCGGKDSKSPSASEMEYSELLNIVPADGYTKVEIRTRANGNPVATYLLVPRDKEVPSGLPQGEVIRIPVKSLVVNTTAYALPLKELKSLNVIKGVTDASFFNMPEIQQGLKSGAIVDLGNSQQPSVEKIVELHPDGIMINLFEGMSNAALPTAGVPYIKFADNLESSPLGRAEWIKFLGVLTGTETVADSIFNQVEKKYNALARKAANVTKRPKVLTDNMYEGIWYVPAGNSVAAKVLKDAGGDFPWKDNGDTGSLSLSYEEVLDKANDADIWILKVFGTKLDSDKLAQMDNRYTQFLPYKKGNVWYSDTQDSGLFDYAAFHPELLLSDYLAIIHPEVVNGQVPRFFKKMVSK